MRRALLFACTLMCALAAIVPSASAVIVRQSHGHFLGITPRGGVSTTSIPGTTAHASAIRAAASAGGGSLTYHGGPVLHSSAPYLIFWTPSGDSVPASWQSLLERYFTDVAADSGKSGNVYGVNRQFTDGSGFADYRQTFSTARQAILDTNAFPARDAANCPNVGTGYPKCVTDAQLQAEISRLVAADGLPTDGSPGASALGPNAPIYFVVLPSDVNVCFGGGTGDCANNVFCAYHSSLVDSAGNDILYAAIPTLPLAAGQNPKGCQSDGNSVVQEPNANPADVVIKYLSHEDSEAITNPLGDAWFSDSSGNEDGDNCNAYGAFNPASGRNPNAFLPSLGGSASTGTLYNQKINNDPYYIQSEWSNGDGTCKMKPAAATLAARFTQPSGPNAVGTTLNFDPSASSSSAGLVAASWNLGDGSPAVFRPGGTSLTTVAHAYSGVAKYSVTLTLVDGRGNESTNTQLVVVGQPPNAVFTFAPGQTLPGGVVSFDGSASNDPLTSLVSYSWSFGDGSSASGVTANHSYANPGTYMVSLKVTDKAGNSDTVTQAVTVASPPPPVPPPATTAAAHPHLPIAAFVVKSSHPTAGLPVTFDGASSVGVIAKYHWAFGDGSKHAWGALPTHVYSRPGTYEVSLTVTDAFGASATIVKTVTIARAASITKLAVRRQHGRPTLLVAVNGPGSVSAFHKTIRLRRSGTARFGVRLTRAQLRALSLRRTITIRVALTFAPLSGRRSSRRLAIRIHVAPSAPARFEAAIARRAV